MRKTNAQRQAEYRQRHLRDVNGDLERIQTLVSAHAKRQLERLAACYAVTQPQVLEHVLAGAERAALDGLPTTAHDAYYAMRLPEPLRCSISAVQSEEPGPPEQ